MVPSEELELKIYRFTEHFGTGQWQAVTIPALAQYCGGANHTVLVDALHDLHTRGYLELRQWRQPVGWVHYSTDRVYFSREFQMRKAFSGRRYFEALEHQDSTHHQSKTESTEQVRGKAQNAVSMSSHSHPPTAFVSHSTQDHAFVERFATDLRAHGVDAWYSGWEIKPGDSIRARIDDGLKGCEYFIIVLSNNSITRPWVQTELDSATVRKLSGKVRKIIPIKIEKCGDLPPTLDSLCWEDFSDKPYKSALDRVLDSILERDVRPPLGSGATTRQSAQDHNTDIRGEAFNFSGYGIHSEGHTYGHWSAHCEITFEIYVCNHGPVNTTLRSIHLDGSKLVPPVTFTVSEGPPDSLELRYGIGKTISLKANAIVDGMTLADMPPITMDTLSIYVEDAFGQKHPIRIRSGEQLAFGQP